MKTVRQGFTFQEALIAIFLISLGGGAIFTASFQTIQSITKVYNKVKLTSQIQNIELQYRSFIKGVAPAYWYKPVIKESDENLIEVQIDSLGTLLHVKIEENFLLLEYINDLDQTLPLPEPFEQVLLLPEDCSNIALELLVSSQEIPAGLRLYFEVGKQPYILEESFGSRIL